MKERLYCEVTGHFWTRQAKPGRKPTCCPKHAGITREDALAKARAAKAQALAKAHEAKAKATAARAQTVAQKAQAILDRPDIHPELKRKLAYCQAQLSRGGRDSNDVELLNDRRQALIREANRRAS